MVQSLDVSIPFIAGQWSLPSRREARFRDRRMFQSPSLRGSGRFTLFAIEGCTSLIGFNPLHCGAVVASEERARKEAADRVSIPFIAGQWSLLIAAALATLAAWRVSIPFIAGQWSLHNQIEALARLRSGFNPLHCGAVVASPAAPEPAGRPGPRFNPLHCGAVVASSPDAIWIRFLEVVSIPFIAGQWSLQRRAAKLGADLSEFQSPSLRGSGRFLHCRLGDPPTRRSFNPLHCGAVVASGSRPPTPARCGWFQSPSLRGSGRFYHPSLPRRGGACVFQSPSLRGSGRFMWAPLPYGRGGGTFQSPSLRGSGRFSQSEQIRKGIEGFNPLHCGAVVASRRPGASGRTGAGCFNPLHCGAVVASQGARPDARRPSGFNPLHCGAVVASSGGGAGADRPASRFNPLHCGAVVASLGRGAPKSRRPSRFNPLHCGAVVASPPSREGGAPAMGFVSIPFIAGQWSLPHGGARRWKRRRVFQSPSLRGSGRFGRTSPDPDGSGEVSIPFIAGQWSLPFRDDFAETYNVSFNPLHCGAVVAS